MTKAKAATVTSALVNAGINAHASQLPDATWVVYATSNGSIPVDTVKTFQDNQGGIVGVTEAVTFA